LIYRDTSIPKRIQVNPTQINAWIKSRIDRSLAKPTRIHILPTSKDGKLFVKREDELGSGISGSKLRKFASLIPALKAREIDEVALIGGPNSNNLVGLLQVLKEANILPWLFIRQAADQQLRGNALLLDLLIDKSQVTYIQRSEWENVESIAADFLKKRDNTGATTFLIPEGASCLESLPGSLSLAQDLRANEQQNGLSFNHIYVDSDVYTDGVGNHDENGLWAWTENAIDLKGGSDEWIGISKGFVQAAEQRQDAANRA